MTTSAPLRRTCSAACSRISSGRPARVWLWKPCRWRVPGRCLFTVRRRERFAGGSPRRVADPESADPHDGTRSACGAVRRGEGPQPVRVLTTREDDAHAQHRRRPHRGGAVRRAQDRRRRSPPRVDGCIGDGRMLAAQHVHQDGLRVAEALRPPRRVDPDELELLRRVPRGDGEGEAPGVAGGGPAQLLGRETGLRRPSNSGAGAAQIRSIASRIQAAASSGCGR